MITPKVSNLHGKNAPGVIEQKRFNSTNQRDKIPNTAASGAATAVPGDKTRKTKGFVSGSHDL